MIQTLRLRGLWPAKKVQPSQRRNRLITRYEVRDTEGQLVAVHVRRSLPAGDKEFHWEKPDGTTGLGGERVADLPLYGIHFLRDRPGQLVIICEGEKAAQSLLGARRLAVGTVTGAAGTPTLDVLRPLIGHQVVLWPDADEPGYAHMRRIAATLRELGVLTRMLEWHDAPPHGDAVDFLAQYGVGERLDTVLAAPAPAEGSDPLDTTTLLAAVIGFIRDYVVLTEHQAVACALWGFHAWAFEAADTTPYLKVESAERESGKTRLLETFSVLIPSPWFTGRTTVAALVRKVTGGCTLLLDETDRAFQSGEEYSATLLAILNSGYRRGGAATLCVGQGAQIEVRDFQTFGAKAFAGLSKLPDTVASRSIPIRLRRKRKDEPVRRFRWREAEAVGADLRKGLATWAASAVPRLRDARPDIPDALGDRTAECWEPLLAIADLAGGEWPRLAREAAVATHSHDIENDSIGVRILADARRAFDDRHTDRLTTEEILAVLRTDPEAPWGEWGKAGLTARGLSSHLRPFGIRPGVIRVGEATPRGYRRGDFLDAFARYLPFDPQHPQQASTDAEFSRSSFPQQTLHVADEEPDESPHQKRPVADVADGTPSRRDDDSRSITKGNVNGVLEPVEALCDGHAGGFSGMPAAGGDVPNRPPRQRKLSLRWAIGWCVASLPQEVRTAIKATLARKEPQEKSSSSSGGAGV